jgi:DNA-binding NarL/FixJ family response regulator
MRELRQRRPEGRVIVLTSYLDDDRLLPAIQAGAAGYLLKDGQPLELARAVRAAHAGEALLDPAVAARLVAAVAQAPAGGGGDGLTARELEVLAHIGGGLSNKRIARARDLRER